MICCDSMTSLVEQLGYCLRTLNPFVENQRPTSESLYKSDCARYSQSSCLKYPGPGKQESVQTRCRQIFSNILSGSSTAHSLGDSLSQLFVLSLLLRRELKLEVMKLEW